MSTETATGLDSDGVYYQRSRVTDWSEHLEYASAAYETLADSFDAAIFAPSSSSCSDNVSVSACCYSLIGSYFLLHESATWAAGTEHEGLWVSRRDGMLAWAFRWVTWPRTDQQILDIAIQDCCWHHERLLASESKICWLIHSIGMVCREATFATSRARDYSLYLIVHVCWILCKVSTGKCPRNCIFYHGGATGLKTLMSYSHMDHKPLLIHFVVG
jgi:hypothetical protein